MAKMTLPHAQMVVLLTGMMVNTNAFFSPPLQAFTKVKLHAIGNTPVESEIQNKISNFADEKASSLLDFISNEANLHDLSAKSSEHKDMFASFRENAKFDVNLPTTFLESPLRKLDTMKASIKGVISQVSPILSDANNQLSDATKILNDVAKENASVMRESLASAGPVLNDAVCKIESSLYALKHLISQWKTSIDGGTDLFGKFDGIKDKLSHLISVVTSNEFVDKLHTSEYGPFFVAAAVALITGVHNIIATKKVAAMESKAREAAEAAVVSAKSARHARGIGKTIKEEARRKVNTMEAEKNMMEAEIIKLKRENTEFIKVIKSATSMKPKPRKAQKDVSVVKKSTKDSDTGARKKVKELQAEKLMMEASISELKKEHRELDTLVKLLKSNKKSPVSVENENVTDTRSMKKAPSTAATKETVTEELAMPPPEPKAETPSEQKFEKDEELLQECDELDPLMKPLNPKPEAKTSSIPKSKKADEVLQAETERVEEVSQPILNAVEESNDNPWGHLKDSILKKKKKSELIEYLALRNVAVPDMVKAEIIDYIKNESLTKPPPKTKAESPPDPKFEKAEELLQECDELDTLMKPLKPKPEAITSSKPKFKKADEVLQAETERVEEVSQPILNTVEESNDNPWGHLKDSILKRKKKSELIEYLALRNVVIPDMVKAEIIDYIKNESLTMRPPKTVAETPSEPKFKKAEELLQECDELDALVTHLKPKQECKTPSKPKSKKTN